jgi:hypothetical protein
LRSFSFDNNGLVKPSCWTVALYGIGGTYKIRLRAVRGPGDGSSWNLAFCGPKNVLQRLQNISVFERKIPFSLITGNKVKKKHTSQGIVKKKRTKPTKEFWEVSALIAMAWSSLAAEP